MAKKIKLDFSKVEERSGYNQRQMPEGLYEAKVSGIEYKDAQDGTAMLVYGIQPTSSKYATRNFPHYCKLQQNQLWKLRDLFVAAGETIPKKATQIDPEKIIGGRVAIEVGDGTGQWSDRSEIVSVYPLNILEDLNSDDETDEDDEESEDFEDGDEGYDDSDDSDDEVEDEDLDEDEDEFEDDDEDLDDEDEEDDEELEEEDDEEDEEPEPAPKRAAKKAPAKKAPAKAAAKPAPKRSVKRAR